MGERAGNADLLSVILAIKFARGIGDAIEIGDDIDLSVAWKMGHYVADAFGLPVPINQVGIGANAFAHESGIHADGMLKDRHNYEIYDYELLGRAQWSYWRTGRVITTGEYGGMNGLRHVYEQLGITFEDSEAALQVLNLVQATNAHNQMQLTPDELHFIAEHPREVHKLLSLSIPDPAEHIGVRRVQDLVEEEHRDNGDQKSGADEGDSEHVPWTEVAPRRVKR
jgi:homocitrate synthase NifV